ncbi:MAG: cellulase family glycosylhydrolase [Chloroflexales bacterium]
MLRFKRLAGVLTLLLLGAFASQLSAVAQTLPIKTYLPAISRMNPPTIFGVETGLSAISDSQVTAQAQSLGATWLRLNGVMWSAVEPVRGTYNWAALSQLDSDLQHAQAAGLTPVVIIRGTPTWASVTNSNCAAVQDQYFPDYANFLAALAQRYRGQVSYWELGNEPDVDPSLVPADSPFGCWGDLNDQYYGGERYGRMLRAVVPAMRAANPSMRIVIGGLLLDHPAPAELGVGDPGMFLDGILRSGAADSFDILAYHSYPSYIQQPNYDHDLNAGNSWSRSGGWTLGKAKYLRDVMARYGVNKPLWLNETGLICTPPYAACSPPSNEFFEAQSDHLVRIMSRAAAADIQQVSWYTLDGPGWRSAGLLDASQSPRPAYSTYKLLIETIGQYTSARSVDYGPDIEAYRFSQRDGSVVDVLWSRDGSVRGASVPISAHPSAMMARDGTTPGLSKDSTNIFVAVGFRPVYIKRAP